MLSAVSENTFFSFLKKNKAAIIFILIFILGVIFLILPQREEKNTAVSSEEMLLETLCAEIEGAGECSVILNIKDGEVVAAAVLCEGGDSPRVESDVKRLISTLYGIGYNKITVLKLSK